MASPPFVINTVIPGDSDIVGQFPLIDRTVRDIIQSWILANHDTNGNHVTMTMPWQSSAPSTPGASLIKIYADVSGRLKIVYPDGTLGFVGLPPGSVIYTSSSTTPVGYLVADGSAVSRSTYADLFAQIASDFGAGNGTTTFNIPDIKGRVIAGEDSGANRLTGSYFGSAVRAAVGGSEAHALTLNEITAHDHGGLTGAMTVNATHTHGVAGGTSGGTTSAGTGAGGPPAAVAGPATITINAVNIDHFHTIPVAGSSVAHTNIQPTIILRALIKT